MWKKCHQGKSEIKIHDSKQKGRFIFPELDQFWNMPAKGVPWFNRNAAR